MQQVTTLLAQQCLEFLAFVACSMQTKAITANIVGDRLKKRCILVQLSCKMITMRVRGRRFQVAWGLRGEKLRKMKKMTSSGCHAPSSPWLKTRRLRSTTVRVGRLESSVVTADVVWG